MPNTVPANDCAAVTQFICEKAQRGGLARVYPIATITVGQRGEQLTDFGALRKAGAIGVSDDGFCVANSHLMRRALESAKDHGLTVISHCEDVKLSNGGAMHEGAESVRMGFKGIPGASEEVMVFREMALARLTGCPVHIAHVSTKGAVELIRRAKHEGLSVTCETAPHYFTLDHRAVKDFDTRAKMNPPLRTPEDVEAVKEGLAEGVIDAIASDHAPHSEQEKAVPFDQAAFGIIGLQTTLPLTLELVRDGILALPDAIRKISLTPASILGISDGKIDEGGAANLCIINPEHEYVVREEQILSKSKNSPFVGWTMRGLNELTMIGGRIVWDERAHHSRRG
jgi:dihydroorotase